MGNPIVFFEITCKDAAPLAAFYSNVFGWTVTPHPSGDYHTVTTGESIDGMITQLPDDMRARLTVFVSTADLDASIVDVESSGGSVVFPAMDLPNGERIAMISDPAGTMVGLIQQR